MTANNLYRALTVLMKHISQDKNDQLLMTISELSGNQNLKILEIMNNASAGTIFYTFADSVMNYCMPLVQLS